MMRYILLKKICVMACVFGFWALGHSGVEARGNTAQEASAAICPLGHRDRSVLRAVRKELFSKINDAREKAGLKALRNQKRLALASQRHAEYMAETGHVRTRGRGRSSAGDRAIRVGYNFKRLWENLAAGQTNATAVFYDWMNSPAHKANLLQARANHLGIGFARGRAPISFGRSRNIAGWTPRRMAWIFV